ncbi:MAG TPA: calcium-binding protein [Azospirillaceae bacterium]|nr:calcium-binding protein [Azospirillaceae bacterium]
MSPHPIRSRAQTRIGTANNDNLHGSDAYNTLRGLAGDDRLYGYGAEDVLNGGAGNDSLIGGPGDDTLIGGTGFDWADYSAFGGAILADVDRLDVGGLSINAGPDRGQDRLIGIENLIGGAYGDQLVGDRGGNTLIGNAGTDTITGNAGNDFLDGGDGDDRLLAGPGDDSMVGDTGDDYLVGATGNDSMAGGAGGDTLLGGDGDDILLGGEGRDRLDGGAGADSLHGGAGNDIYMVDDAADMAVDVTSGGIDTVFASVSFTLGGHIEILDFTAAPAGVTGQGNGSGNTMIGSTGSDTLAGLGGNDVLTGGHGNDVLEGGQGRDSLFGGSGNDVLTGGAGGDLFFAERPGLRGDHPWVGDDIVTDFDPVNDRLVFTYGNLQAVLDTTQDNGRGGVVIDLGGGTINLNVAKEFLNSTCLIFGDLPEGSA